MIARLMALVAVVFAPAPTFAQPDPSHSTIPQGIVLVGMRGNTPDPAGYFEVVVRDAGNAPIEGAKVVVDIGGCPQLTLGSQQPYPGVALEQCSPPVVRAFTDASGTARFVVTGGVADRGAAEGADLGCGAIRASVGSDTPVNLGGVRVAALDQDGVDGAQPNDIGLWLGDYCPIFCYHQRSDYNGDGVLGPGDDLSFLISDVCAGGSDRAAARCDRQMANHLLLRAEDGGLDLAWDDCRGGLGTVTKTFACNTNSGSHLLIASFRAPAGVSSLAGFEAVIEVSSEAGGVLPQWWRVEPLTGCRAGAATATGSNLGFGCSEVGATTLCQVFEYPAPSALPHMEQVRIEGTASGSLVAGEEYSLFGLQVGHGKTTGPGSCAGCSQPVAFVLQSLRLRQQVSPDLVMNVTSGSSGAVAYWQGPPAGFSFTDVPAVLAGADWLAPPAPNPAHGPVAFRFGLARESSVSLVLHDLAGRRLRVLESGTLPAGEHTASWDGRDERSERVAGGLYFVRLVRGERVLTRPFVRIR